jgi:ketosteroid isomerase-like protein
MDSRYKTQADIDKMTLEQRLQRLEDFDQIRKLKSQYHVLINDCRFDEFADLFTEDAVVDMGYMGGEVEPRRGKAEIHEMFATIPKNLQQIKQFIHNHMIEVDGDTGIGWAFLEARYGSGGTSYNVAGKYDDTYRRVDGRWLFATMHVSFYFTVPSDSKWAGAERHHLVRRPNTVLPPADSTKPNPPVAYP